MKCAIVALVAFAGLSTSATANVLSRGAVASPVERVVNLLKDLQARVKSDGRKEGFMYDKFECWCTKTSARKAKAIEDAKADLKTTGADILALKGKIDTLIADIQTLMTDMKANEKDQNDLTVARQKENEEYMAEAGEMKEAIAALEKCVTVLSDATFKREPTLLQQTSQAELSRRVKDAVAAMPVRALSMLAPSKLSALRVYAAELASGKAQYTPQSGTIQGILRDMYDTFGTDLEDMDTAEAGQNTAYEGLMGTLQEKMNIMQDSVRKKEKDKAEAEVDLAEATQLYEDTEEQMNADIIFFDATKKTCEDNAADWKARLAVRTDELEAISKAIEVLSSDDARQLFDDSIKPGIETFLQVSQDTVVDEAAVPVTKAYEALKKQATKTQSNRLALLAAQVRMTKAGHFDTVLITIDKLIGDLVTEQTDDNSKRDQCKDEYKNIKGVISDLLWRIEVNDANIQKFDDKIEKREDELDKTIKEIKKTEDDIKEMIKVRGEENSDFLAAKKDDEDAIVLLNQAKGLMEGFYTKHTIEIGTIQGGEGVDSFLQMHKQAPTDTFPAGTFARSNDTAPEFKLSDKGNRKLGGKGILAILDMIVQDLGDEITNSIAAEAAALKAFTTLKAAADKLVLELKSKETSLKTTITRLKKEKGDEEKDKTANETALKAEETYKTKISPDCDFAIDAFEDRMKSRTAEMEGLTQAKEFLSGYKENHSGGAVVNQLRVPTLIQTKRLRH